MTAGTQAPFVDHVILGIAELDQGIAAFERATGVRPAYGGKHSFGSHNALLSLRAGAYLEIIAPQPGMSGSGRFPGLRRLEALTPVGWAVGSREMEPLRRRLACAGFALSEPEEGSRVTPDGGVLRWRTFDVENRPAGAPFFIVWSPEAAHPSSTAPGGCTLERLTASGPDSAALGRLLGALDPLGLPLEVAAAEIAAISFEIGSPNGKVRFASSP